MKIIHNIAVRTYEAINCRSIASLGGSAMQSYGGNMTFTEKTAIAAVIGGTAEALGGGKFANGAVTGAFVMAYNHLMHEEPEETPFQIAASYKKLALALRYSPFALGSSNPFFMAEAIYIDMGAGFVGAEYDGGYFLVLAGEDAGALIPYTEHGGGGAPEASVGLEVGRIDLADKSIPFRTEMLFGERIKSWGGAVFVGGAVSYSKPSGGVQLISTSINIGISINPFGGFSAGGNRGLIDPKRK
jgi:hypothetical protein